MVDNTLEGVIASTEIWTPLPTTDFSQVAIGNAEEVRILKTFYDWIDSEQFDRRKDGTEHLIHPLTVTHFLQEANAPFLAQAAGMLHDFPEEQVDLIIKGMGLETIKDRQLIRTIEDQTLDDLQLKLNGLFSRKGFFGVNANNLVAVVDLLTRHKRENYYRSISRIFACPNPEIRDVAIQDKLADRIHAAQTLQPYDQRGKIYQCFKNLFILNNAKRHLIETGRITSGYSDNTDDADPTEKLFKKCCKATEVAFWNIIFETKDKKVVPALPYLNLAFDKYALQHKGLGQVTEFDPQETHPMWLFQAIIKKYDAWLHKEEDDFVRREKREKDYCKDFFGRYNLGKKQIESLIFYKDAFALEKVVTRLLYQPNYVIKGFGCLMCSRDNICSLDYGN